jgi:tetratricopeptide (TPR) repeat protein
LRRGGRFTEARERLAEALEVLRPEPDEDTVAAIADMATLEVFGGGRDAHRIASEAVAMGQALGVGPSRLAPLFISRGLAAAVENRFAEAAADIEYAVRLAERVGETVIRSRALLNLASISLAVDPAAAAAAARTAVDLARKLGDRYLLPAAIGNVSTALLFIGDWTEAERWLVESVATDGFDDDSLGSAQVAMFLGLVRALRGDAPAVPDETASFAALRASEDLQDLSAVALVDAFVAAARGQRPEALQHAQTVLRHTPAVGIATEFTILSWPLAVRVAFELGDTAAVDVLLAMLDEYPRGHVPPLLRAEQSLALARQRAAAGDPDADAALAAAVAELRTVGSPYHLAHALLDRAEHLADLGQTEEAALLREEATTIADRLGAAPLRKRAEASVAARLS